MTTRMRWAQCTNYGLVYLTSPNMKICTEEPVFLFIRGRDILRKYTKLYLSTAICAERRRIAKKKVNTPLASLFIYLTSSWLQASDTTKPLRVNTKGNPRRLESHDRIIQQCQLPLAVPKAATSSNTPKLEWPVSKFDTSGLVSVFVNGFGTICHGFLLFIIVVPSPPRLATKTMLVVTSVICRNNLKDACLALIVFHLLRQCFLWASNNLKQITTNFLVTLSEVPIAQSETQPTYHRVLLFIAFRY